MSERLVNDAVRSLRLTRVIIAHRPETIASADRVLVMEQGRIVQELRPQAERTDAMAAAEPADAPAAA
ncbi:Heterocyst differentiation ATP-binding protein HepA [compost metagenome]